MDTLILTGAIRPSYPVQRNSPYQRLNDYLCAITQWLKIGSFEHIIFCDASGCVIPEDIFHDHRFESLSFDVSHLSKIYEPGRAEAETLDYVLRESRFDIQSFFKCTGRLFVKNFHEILTVIDQNRDAPVYLREWSVAGWADTRFFWMKTEYFNQNIRARIPELVGRKFNGYLMESLFHEYLEVAAPFPNPYFLGHSGHENVIYDEDFARQDIADAYDLIQRHGRERFNLNATDRNE